MITGITRALRRFIPHLRVRLIQLSLTSLAAGLAEALALVLIVRVAVSLTSDDIAAFDLPLLGASVSDNALLLIAAGLAAANLALHLLETYFRASLNAAVFIESRRSALHAFSQATWWQQSREREGALQETVTTLTAQAGNLALILASLITGVMHLGVLLTIACIVDPLSTAVVVAFGLLLFLALRPIARLTERRATDWVAGNTAFAEEVTSLSALAMELRVFGGHAEAQRRLDELSRDAAHRLQHMRIASGFGGTLYRDIALLLLVGTIATLVNVSDELLVGFGIVALLILRSVGSAQRVQSALQAAREGRPAIDSLIKRIAALEGSSEPERSHRLDHLGVIELRGVTYDYVGERAALTDIDLTIRPGEALGVVGPSGSGKSTLAQVLLRLRMPTAGRITVSGVDYDTIASADWSRLVALVPQDARLLEASIAENIRFFRVGFDDEAVMRAARDALLEGDLERFPAGLDTKVGPRGSGLSGGQRQRLTIARALLGQPELLVLDEPTSALDGKSEALLNKTIADLKGSTTLVIIAHRLTTLQSCDRIAVVADGRLAQIGTSQALAAEPGFYQTVLDALRED